MFISDDLDLAAHGYLFKQLSCELALGGGSVQQAWFQGKRHHLLLFGPGPVLDRCF